MRSIENDRAMNPVKFSAQKLLQVSRYDHFTACTHDFLFLFRRLIQLGLENRDPEMVVGVREMLRIVEQITE